MDDAAFARELAGLRQRVRTQKVFYWLGLLVGFMPAWRYQIERAGYAAGKSWFDQLFESSIGLEFVLLLVSVLLALSGGRETITAFKPAWTTGIDRAVILFADALTDVLVTTSVFLLGIGTMSFLYGLITATYTGALLSILLIAFDSLLFGVWLVSRIVIQRGKPFRGPWAGLVLLSSGVGVFTWFLAKGI